MSLKQTVLTSVYNVKKDYLLVFQAELTWETSDRPRHSLVKSYPGLRQVRLDLPLLAFALVACFVFGAW